jgi:hypothetical protein
VTLSDCLAEAIRDLPIFRPFENGEPAPGALRTFEEARQLGDVVGLDLHGSTGLSLCSITIRDAFNADGDLDPRAKRVWECAGSYAEVGADNRTLVIIGQGRPPPLHATKAQIATFGTVLLSGNRIGTRGAFSDLLPAAELVRKLYGNGDGRLLDQGDGSSLEHRAEDLERVRRRPPELDWNALAGRSPPPRQWAERDWLPFAPCLLAGAPGIGKTLVAQQWASCVVLERGFVDKVTRPLRVLFWAGEDPHDELWRRQVRIAVWLGVPLEAFADRLVMRSYDGEVLQLCGVAQGQLVATSMLTELHEQIGDYRADYVFLDPLAMLFGGNENDRHHTTTFGAMLRKAARPTGAGICVLGHTSKAQGSEFSGSTAWEAFVRSRLYLGRELPDAGSKGDQSEDDGVRYLCRRKANYSARDWRRLSYRDGVLVPDERPADTTYAPHGEFAKDVVMRAMRKLASMGEYVSGSENSRAYLPNVARNFKLLDRLSVKDFAAAMRQLRVEGRLVVRQVGQYSNRTPRMGLVLVEPESP